MPADRTGNVCCFLRIGHGKTTTRYSESFRSTTYRLFPDDQDVQFSQVLQRVA